MHIVLLLHSLIRWLIVLAGVWTIYTALSGIRSKRAHSNSDQRPGLLFMIFCDIQLLLGLVLYFSNGWFDKLKHFAEIKSDVMNRFFAMEHFSMMLIAWILVHLARVLVKRAPNDLAAHKRSLIWFGLAFLLILSSIPWPFREALGRTWLYGF